MIGFLDDMFQVHLYYAGQINNDFQPPLEKPPQMAGLSRRVVSKASPTMPRNKQV